VETHRDGIWSDGLVKRHQSAPQSEFGVPPNGSYREGPRFKSKPKLIKYDLEVPDDHLNLFNRMRGSFAEYQETGELPRREI
jgi:hypothetical protein